MTRQGPGKVSRGCVIGSDDSASTPLVLVKAHDPAVPVLPVDLHDLAHHTLRYSDVARPAGAA